MAIITGGVYLDSPFKRNFLKAELREEGTTRLSEARDERHGRDKVYLVKVRSGKGTGR